MACKYAAFRANETGKAALRLIIKHASDELARIKKPKTRQPKRTQQQIEQLKKEVEEVLKPFIWRIPAASILDFHEEQNAPGWAIRNAMLVHNYHCKATEGDTTITAEEADAASNCDTAYRRYIELVTSEGQKDVYLAALAISDASQHDEGSITSLKWMIDDLVNQQASIKGKTTQKSNRKNRSPGAAYFSQSKFNEKYSLGDFMHSPLALWDFCISQKKDDSFMNGECAEFTFELDKNDPGILVIKATITDTGREYTDRKDFTQFATMIANIRRKL